MNSNGWCDIGYSWVLGSDFKFYEGRGWNAQGAHTPGFNDWNYGLTVIGDYTHRLPTSKTMERVNDFLECGIDAGYFRENVKVRGHRQVRETECPGENYYHYLFENLNDKFLPGVGRYF